MHVIIDSLGVLYRNYEIGTM